VAQEYGSPELDAPSRVRRVVTRAEIRYLQIPTDDVDASAGFYERALGWTIRTRGDGSTAFDDTTAEVSGEWVLDRQPADDMGVLVYVRVDDVEGILRKIAEAGGKIIVPRTPQGEGMAYATFRDPVGNVLGIFQEGS
jgi:predicted enzyme related to lactoylglutathione lyase